MIAGGEKANISPGENFQLYNYMVQYTLSILVLSVTCCRIHIILWRLTKRWDRETMKTTPQWELSTILLCLQVLRSNQDSWGVGSMSTMDLSLCSSKTQMEDYKLVFSLSFSLSLTLSLSLVLSLVFSVCRQPHELVQVKRSDGGYIDVPYMSDAILVNLGALMQQWTSDKYLATVSWMLSI